VYSLGIILYELLTGHPPYRFPTRSPVEIEQRIRTAEPKKPSTAVYLTEVEDDGTTTTTPELISRTRATVPERLYKRLAGDLDNICMKTLRKEPEQRYSSVEHLRQDIDAHLSGLPVSARPATIGYRVQKFVRRHTMGVTTAAGVFVLVAGLITFYTIRLAEERDLAQLEARKAAQVSEFLTGLFKVSDPSESRGETITARELLERGANRIERELAGQPEVQILMMDVIGGVYMSLGLYEDALRLYEKALNTRRDLRKQNEPESARIMNNLGVLQRLRGEYKAAEGLARQVLAIQREYLGEEHLDVASSLNNLAEALRVQGNYAAADTHYRRALTIRRKLLGEEHGEIADGMNNLALLLYARGEYQAAEHMHRESLAMRRKLLGEDHPDVSNSMNNLALTLKAIGKYEEAGSLYRQALLQRQKVLGNDEPRTVNTMKNLGNLLHAKGEIVEAESVLRESLRLFRKRLPDEHPYVATNLFDLATLLRDKGDLAPAETLFRRALELRETASPEGQFEIAQAKGGLGHCLLAMRRFGQAEPLLLECYQYFRAERGHHDRHTQQALDGIIKLYEAWGKAESASQYRNLLVSVR
jgi:serine/threonine-protein kinase